MNGMSKSQPETTHVYIAEYVRLKEEQLKRIEYRDHMIHVHLALVGALLGWGITHETPYVVLIVPWVSVILGWAYLVNDNRISALGAYCGNFLAERVTDLLHEPDGYVFGWEAYHKSDRPRRFERKVIQLFVDVLTFIGPGTLSITWFLVNTPTDRQVKPFCLAEMLLLCLLLIQIVRNADLSSSIWLPRDTRPSRCE